MSSSIFRSEAPPNLSARAKKNPKGAPGFAERENPRLESRAGENGGKGAQNPTSLFFSPFFLKKMSDFAKFF